MKHYMRIFGILMLAAGLFLSACESGSGGSGNSMLSGLLALITSNGSDHAITAFSFTSAKNSGLSADVSGTISGTSIAVTVPYGTTVTALVATFTTTGASVKIGTTAQTSGTTANDFSSAKTYTVTATDGSTQDYTVTVTIAENTAKEITAFGFTSAKNSVLSANVTGALSGTNISVTVPYGTTSVTALVATFTTTGTSVKIGSTEQTSGTTANDFSSAKTYTVTAADGSTQNYTVTVSIASNSAKAITAFSFPAVSLTGPQPLDNNSHPINGYGTTISGTSITVRLPYGSTSMVAAFATTGASVSVGGVMQTSEVTSNDFTNPMTYRVTAADGSTQDYTVTVLFAPAVNSRWHTYDGGVLSTYWITSYVSCPTDADEFTLQMTCDAINAGSDTFTMVVQLFVGDYSRHLTGYIGLSGPYLTVPSDTTATYPNSGNQDYRMLKIVGPLTSIQSVIAQLQYVPPATINEELIVMELTDKNGLMAVGRIRMEITDTN